MMRGCDDEDASVPSEVKFNTGKEHELSCSPAHRKTQRSATAVPSLEQTTALELPSLRLDFRSN
jgi:hypothetical protein